MTQCIVGWISFEESTAVTPNIAPHFPQKNVTSVRPENIGGVCILNAIPSLTSLHVAHVGEAGFIADSPSTLLFWGYDEPVKSKPKSDEYKAFENVLGKVLKVSHTELKDRLEKEKAAKKQTSSSDHASDESN